MDTLNKNTIAAIATPIGRGGIAIIRISGSASLDVLRSIFAPFTAMDSFEYRKMYYGTIFDNEEPIDQCLAVVFEAGASFTGELTAEIHCHGGYIAANRILQLILSKSVALAGAGEFTKRAFLNGKIDLAQAEAVADIIDADSVQAAKAAAKALTGGLGTNVIALQNSLKDILALIEAAIDYPDEIDEDHTRDKISEILLDILSNCKKLTKTYNTGRIMHDGLYVCLAGRPNVGKSSLLNAISGRESAIVTPIEGTTRDVLHELITINGLAVHLFDTAGLREAQDEIEQLGIERTRITISTADAVFYVIDAQSSLSTEDIQVLEEYQSKISACIINKTDINSGKELEQQLQAMGYEVIACSAKDGIGIDNILQFIGKLAQYENTTEPVIITQQRHYSALNNAIATLESAITANENMPIDFVSIDVWQAWRALGEITGETVSENIIDTIFEKFCVGK